MQRALLLATSWRGVSLVCLALLAGCYPIKQYRSLATPRPQLSDCKKGDAPSRCSFLLTQQKAAPHAYTIAVAEFDDQGVAYSSAQIDRVVARVAATQPASDSFSGQIVVAFAHGWFHDARPGDSNLRLFGQMLEVLSSTELSAATAAARKPRRVVGVYLAWRGASSPIWPLKYFTFWNRKDTAHRIGERAATNTLIRVRQAAYGLSSNPHARNRFLVMGHSFGGAVVYSALAQLVANTFLAPALPSSDIPPVADSVILFNAAFEAARLHQLFESAAQLEDRRPTLSLLTSKTDRATGVAFPFARWLNTMFESYRSIDNPIKAGPKIRERKSNSRTIGHFEPYLTHTLLAIPSKNNRTPCQDGQRGPTPEAVQNELKTDAGRIELHLQIQSAIQGVVEGYAADKKAITFGDTCLVRRDDLQKKKLAVFNIAMDKDIWHGHGLEQNEVRKERIMSFLMLFVPFSASLHHDPADAVPAAAFSPETLRTPVAPTPSVATPTDMEQGRSAPRHERAPSYDKF